MSYFKCAECNEIIDGDYKGCLPHPGDDRDCVCEDCYDFLIEYISEETEKQR
jgi:hypothetical protein